MTDAAHTIVGPTQGSDTWDPWNVNCSCGWQGVSQRTEPLARLAFTQHERVVTGEKGIYECGCHPDDIDPWRFGQKLGRKKQCPTHRRAYIPKTDPSKRKPPAVSTREILDALRAKHAADDKFERHAPWFFVEELRVDAGGYQRANRMRQLHDSKGQPRFHENGRPMMVHASHDRQSLDAFAFSMWKRDKYDRVAYEVKVSRSDFLNEVKKPWKREAGMELSNKFVYVTPPGLLKPEEVPEGCGLMEVHPSGHIRTVVKAPHRDVGQPPMEFIVALLRRANLVLRGNV